jgi:hypothetical protein
MGKFPAWVRACSACRSEKIRKPQWLMVNTGELAELSDGEEECAACGSQDIVDRSELPLDSCEGYYNEGP